MKICIGGYAGCGNLGDDAILEGWLSEQGTGGEEITVLSGRPRLDRRRFGVRCVGRRDPFAIFFALLRADRFLCGGGSLLQNETGNLSLFYYLALLRLARLCGCETELLAAGVGPLRGKLARRLTAGELNRCRRLELRDADSAELLASVGVRRELMTVAPDPATRLSVPPPTRRLFLLREAGIAPEEPYLCISLHPVCEEKMTRRIITASLRYFLQKNRIRPLFLCFDRRSDAWAAQLFCRELGGAIAILRQATDALALIDGAHLLLSMRLHPLIFAQMTSTPAVAVSPSATEPKLRSFCAAAGFPHFFAPELSVVDLVSTLDTWG